MISGNRDDIGRCDLKGQTKFQAKETSQSMKGGRGSNSQAAGGSSGEGGASAVGGRRRLARSFLAIQWTDKRWKATTGSNCHKISISTSRPFKDMSLETLYSCPK